MILVLSLAGAGCGSAGGSNESARLPAEVADGFAVRAEQVAAALDAGACDDGLAKARSLQTDLAALSLEPAVRAEALAGAARLVSGINCPVATTAPPPPPAVPTSPAAKGDGGKDKGHKGDKDDD